MKIALLFLIYSLLGFTLISAQKIKKEAYGPIKTIRTIHYEANVKFGNIEKGKRIDNEFSHESVEVFNIEGYRKELQFFNLGGYLASVRKNDYSNGKLMSVTEYKGNNIVYKIIYKYDEVNRKSIWFSYDSTGNLESKGIKILDSKGNVIETNMYDFDGELSTKFTYLYDNQDNEIEQIIYSPDGKVTGKTINEYDNNGNITHYTNVSGPFTREYRYKYDERGNKIESIDEKNSIFTSSYEYDKYGNWIKEIYFNNYTPSGITERVLEYYDSKSINNTVQEKLENHKIIDNGFTKINIQEIGSIVIPKSMELRDDKSFLALMITNAYDELSIKIVKPSIVVQPIGINQNKKGAADVYSRILVSVINGKAGDNYKYNESIHLTPSELNEFNNITRQNLSADFEANNGKILTWYPVEFIKINGVNVLKVSYKRQLRDNAPICVENYKFFNNSEVYEITISYRESERELWEADLKKSVFSFILSRKL